jgi:hypothetical protein
MQPDTSYGFARNTFFLWDKQRTYWGGGYTYFKAILCDEDFVISLLIAKSTLAAITFEVVKYV